MKYTNLLHEKGKLEMNYAHTKAPAQRRTPCTPEYCFLPVAGRNVRQGIASCRGQEAMYGRVLLPAVGRKQCMAVVWSLHEKVLHPQLLYKELTLIHYMLLPEKPEQ